MPNYLMGIDIGGTMTKAAIFDLSGGEIAVVSQSTPLIVPQPGYNERDMLELWEITKECIRDSILKAGINPGEIAAVSCTGHGKGLYPWGKNGLPAAHAIASTDHRAKGLIERWAKDGTLAKAREKTLQNAIDCQPVALLAWMKENQPEAYSNIQWVFEAKDYIRFRLTGEAGAEYTDYSGTSLMNLRTKSFDRELLELFGIGEIYDALPPLKTSCELCGGITKEVSVETGLALHTPVSGGMFDIDACAVAMDVMEESKLCTITGTWSINEYPAKLPVSPDGTTLNSIFALPDYYLIEESSPTSAGNLDWFTDNFLNKKKGKETYREIDRLVENAPVTSLLFFPFLYGSNQKNWDSAAFIGMNNAHTKADLLRAIFEGVAFSHKTHIDRLLTLRKPPETIRIAGGVVHSEVWTQIFADVLGIPLEVVATKELGAMGCAISGAICAGLFPDYPSALKQMVNIQKKVLPDAEMHQIYCEKYERYQKIAKVLGEISC